MTRAVIHLCACQILGPKPEIAPSTSDDDQVDTTNKKKASLYMVRTVEWIFKCRFSLSKRSCHVTCSLSVTDL